MNVATAELNLSLHHWVIPRFSRLKEINCVRLALEVIMNQSTTFTKKICDTKSSVELFLCIRRPRYVIELLILWDRLVPAPTDVVICVLATESTRAPWANFQIMPGEVLGTPQHLVFSMVAFGS